MAAIIRTKKKPFSDPIDRQNAIPQDSKSVLADILERTKNDHFAFVTCNHKVISSGSLILDSLCKIRSGDVIRLVGKGAELGKTSQTLVFLGNYMSVMEKSKAMLVIAEGRLSQEIMARSGLKFVFSSDEWDYGTIFVFPCNVFETVASTIETVLRSMTACGEHLAIGLDSMDGLILKEDAKKDLFGNPDKDKPKVAGVPYMTKLLFRRLALLILYQDALLIVTGQYSAAININDYSGAPPRQVSSAGGSNIGHQSSYVWEYLARNTGDYILEDPNQRMDYIYNKILGVYATLDIKKSSTDVTGARVKVPIRKGKIGCAIWTEYEVADLLIIWGLLKKPARKNGDEDAERQFKGAWLEFDAGLRSDIIAIDPDVPEKFQGIGRVRFYLEEHPQVTSLLSDKFRNLCISVTE